MNGFRFVFCAFLLGLLLAACAPARQPTPDLSAGSMKGYELYSWQQNGQWYFSVLIGTNREKYLPEIQSADTSLKGLDALQPVLKKIPAGQFVNWSVRAGLAFPPDTVLSQVQKICQDQGLELSILR